MYPYQTKTSMRVPLENWNNVERPAGGRPESPTTDTNGKPDAEELCKSLIRRQVEIWQIDTDLQEVLYRKAGRDRRN